jgi:choline dehydrogenase-like flavoprotein
VRAPAATVAMLPGRPRINNYAYQTVPQPGLNGRRGYQPRGRCLGGSSAINAMLYVRGHRDDYDDWARAGCAGWSFDEVLPYFKRAEGNQRGASALHGADGPLQVSEQQSPRAITEDFVRAAQACGIPRNDDFNGPEQEGAGLYQVTQFHGGAKNGERCSVAAAYLHPAMKRPNLTVLTGTQALRVVLEGRRAVGVEVRRGGAPKPFRARREVVLCGGAFNSPQLLMLSGIGEPAELAKHGIAVRHALPGVGQNLQDHTDFILAYTSKDTELFGIGAGRRA